jgi:hypothetical protein
MLAASEVCMHAQVIYDPSEVRYEALLDTFFEHVDPTTKNRQGGDVGSQYRSAIYYHTPQQKAAAAKACPLACMHAYSTSAFPLPGYACSFASTLSLLVYCRLRGVEIRQDDHC